MIQCCCYQSSEQVLRDVSPPRVTLLGTEEVFPPPQPPDWRTRSQAYSPSYLTTNWSAVFFFFYPQVEVDDILNKNRSCGVLPPCVTWKFKLVNSIFFPQWEKWTMYQVVNDCPSPEPDFFLCQKYCQMCLPLGKALLSSCASVCLIFFLHLYHFLIEWGWAQNAVIRCQTAANRIHQQDLRRILLSFRWQWELERDWGGGELKLSK